MINMDGTLVRGDVDAALCNCNPQVPLRTTWTEANPRRNFFGYAKYDGKGESEPYVICLIKSPNQCGCLTVFNFDKELGYVVFSLV